LPIGASGGTTPPKQNASGRFEGRTGGHMPESPIVPGTVMPFDGMDIPWLLRMRNGMQRDHPFLIWVLREVRLVDEMPRSTLEKVAKAELRKMLGYYDSMSIRHCERSDVSAIARRATAEAIQPQSLQIYGLLRHIPASQ
jgi:hypothetical protein